MPLAIRDAALFGLTESSATLCFRVEDAAGPVAAEVEVRLDGEVRARSENRGPVPRGPIRRTRLSNTASLRIREP